jgi:hypothetical protein
MWGKAAALITQQKSIVCLQSLCCFFIRILLSFFSRYCAFSRFSIIKSAFSNAKSDAVLIARFWNKVIARKERRPPKKKRPKAIKLQHRKKQARERAISIYHNQQQKLMGPQKHNAPEQAQTTSFLSCGDKKSFPQLKMCSSE